VRVGVTVAGGPPAAVGVAVAVSVPVSAVASAVGVAVSLGGVLVGGGERGDSIDDCVASGDLGNVGVGSGDWDNVGVALRVGVSVGLAPPAVGVRGGVGVETNCSVSIADWVTTLSASLAVGGKRVALGTMVMRGSGVPAGSGVEVGISVGLASRVGDVVGVGSEREQAPTATNTTSTQRNCTYR
jgi:hypothetical protein